MTNEPIRNYFAYLVRLWRLDDGGAWRALVQDAHTGQQFRFESVANLFAFLQEQLGESPGVPTPAPITGLFPEPTKDSIQSLDV